MVTLKFGGTSVADADAIGRLCAIVARESRRRVVVVSALSGVTDQLLAIAAAAASGDRDRAIEGVRQLRERHETLAGVIADAGRRRRLLEALDEYWTDLAALTRTIALVRAVPPAARDAILACGELASSRLVTAALECAGVSAIWVDARTVIETDDAHGQATPLPGPTARRATLVLTPLIDDGRVPVIGGFVAGTRDGVATTLGRGGSDYSASLIGACLGSTEIQIWTDTDGVLTADPRRLPAATTVEALSFREASTLAHFGAKVLHPATVAPAAAAGIPVCVLNSCRPERAGTRVTSRLADRHAPLAGLTHLPECVELGVPLPVDASRGRALADVFNACAAHGATVFLSDVRHALATLFVAPASAAAAVAAACGGHGPVALHADRGLLVAVGDGLTTGRVRGRDIVRAINGGGATVLAVSDASAEGYVALAVSGSDLARALGSAHARFFEKPRRARRGTPSRPATASRGGLTLAPGAEARL